MEHIFKIEDAKKYGVEKAVLLYNIRFWLDKNRANNNNIYEKDGKKYHWTYNSARAFKELFPYMAERSITRYLTELEEDGVIITGTFNKHKYDKTKWFSQNDYCISQNGGSITQNGLTIPDVNTDVNTDTIDIASSQNDLTPNTSVKAKPGISLPDYLGKTTLTRILKLYSLLWQDKYGQAPTVIPFGKAGGLLKPIIGAYTEYQIACLLKIHFSWHGTTGNDEFVYKQMSNRGFSLTDFRRNVDLYIAYLTNSLHVEYNSVDSVKQFAVKSLGEIIKKYKDEKGIK